MRIWVAMTFGVLAGGVLALATGNRPPPVSSGGWVDADAPRRIREYAAAIEDVTGWRGLGDHLVAVAWTESRGNPYAIAKSTGARGWFQLRPESTGDTYIERNPDELFDEWTSVLYYADYLQRLRKWWDFGGSPTWLALRRGAAYPSLVSDRDESSARSVDTRRRYEEGLAAARVDESFMYDDAFPPGFVWTEVEGWS